MISAVTNQGLVRFAFHDGVINTDRLIEFLESLIKDAKRKVERPRWPADEVMHDAHCRTPAVVAGRTPRRRALVAGVVAGARRNGIGVATARMYPR